MVAGSLAVRAAYRSRLLGSLQRRGRSAAYLGLLRSADADRIAQAIARKQPLPVEDQRAEHEEQRDDGRHGARDGSEAGAADASRSGGCAVRVVKAAEYGRADQFVRRRARRRSR